MHRVITFPHTPAIVEGDPMQTAHNLRAVAERMQRAAQDIEVWCHAAPNGQPRTKDDPAYTVVGYDRAPVLDARGGDMRGEHAPMGHTLIVVAR